MKCKFKILRRKDLEKPLGEFVEIKMKLITVILKPKEMKALTETRKLFINFRPKDKFDKKDIIRILTELNFPYSKP